MKYKSPHKPNEINDILTEQVDQLPSTIRNVLTLNAHYYKGTSPVCGNINKLRFELRNRSGHAFSLRVLGRIKEIHSGSEIELEFKKPSCLNFVSLLNNRHKEDKRKILDFLVKWIKLSAVPNQ